MTREMARQWQHHGFLDNLAFLLGPGLTPEQKLGYIETHERPDKELGFKLLPAAARKQWLAWWHLMELAKQYRDEADSLASGAAKTLGRQWHETAQRRRRARERQWEAQVQADRTLDELRAEERRREKQSTEDAARQKRLGEVQYSQWTWPPRGWEGVKTGGGRARGSEHDRSGIDAKEREGERERERGEGKA